MELREYIRAGKHKAFRQEYENLNTLAQEYALLGLSPTERMARRFETLCALEKPVILPHEQICFLRTVKTIPDIFTPEEWADIRKRHFIHELGYMSNLCPNYGRVIACGLEALREKADPYGRRAIDALLDLTERYRLTALAQGRDDLAQILARVPRYGARTFREALQSFRILHYGLWLEGNYHNTVGRFDQYMWPYLEKELAEGTLTETSALELLEDFFLSFNKDSDLYPGVQQGDNGQSLMLGGCGNFNTLSRLCLLASGNNLMIDPKINLRVDKSTPLDIFVLATNLTKLGLGFPQYSNDDIVIPGLMQLGYDRADAENYTVAACWEFIIPGVGRDVANIGALSFPKVIDACLHRDLTESTDFESFMAAVKAEVQASCDHICDGIHDLWFVPSPFLSLLMDEEKYCNFGIHGTGLSTAADSLAVIEKYIFGDRSLSASQLIDAVDSDFCNDPTLLHQLRCEAPKMGTGDPLPERCASRLLEMFGNALAGKRNCAGGVYRAGTGSAMFYLWHANELGASPDGRRKGEPFGTNYSPSLFARVGGPLSVIRAFTVPDLTRTINGGPLTLEFSQTLFRIADSTEKVAALVQLFIRMGGHQLQLNAINADILRAAQAEPEKYPHLIVRIWGWSAYFVELEKEYQEHVLRRQQYRL